jgi:alpha-tubulin suppressor-like RCC1 family protein
MWGDNGSGQLGTGDLVPRVTPTQVKNLPAVAQAVAGRHHTAVLTAGGEVWAWGSNTSGELGFPPGPFQEPFPTPTKVNLPGEVGQVVSVAVGDNFTMILTKEGEIWGWGNNDPMWFGSPPNTEPVSQPVKANIDLNDPASALAAGGSHVAIALVSGTLYGFGIDWSYRIGGRYGNETTRLALPINGLADKTIVQADTSAQFTAAVDANGEVWTLGTNYSQQLGRQDTSANAPALVNGLSDIGAVAAGDNFGMALSEDRMEVYTWGTWGRSELSYHEPTGNEYIPVSTQGLPGPIAQISAGRYHAVGLTAAGDVYTWGSNLYGQLGVISSNWVPEIRVVDLEFWDPSQAPALDPEDTHTATTEPEDPASLTPTESGGPTPSDTASPGPTGADPSGNPDDPRGPSRPDAGGPSDTGGSAQDSARANDADQSDATAGLGTGTGARDPGTASIEGTTPRHTAPRIARFGTRFKTVVIPVGATTKLKVAAYPAPGTAAGSARVTWKTTKASVASPAKGAKTGAVSWRTGSAATLSIKALTTGRTQVTLASPGARPATIQIKVVPAAKAKQVRAVTLTGPGTLAPGRSAVLKPVLSPLGAIRTSARWRSTDPAVATVDAVGRVTGHAMGKAVIVLSLYGKTARKTVTVTANS